MAAKREKRASRPGRKSKTKVVEPKELEEVEGGIGLDDSVVLATSLVLAITVIMVFIANGAYS